MQGLRKGDSIRRVGPGSWSDKTQLMVWVLHEALLQKEQKALAKASTISLARDARRSRLMVRFGSCSSAFNAQVGILGVERGGGDRAGQITESTRKILQRFCTLWGQPPRWFNGPKEHLDMDLFQAVPWLKLILRTPAAALPQQFSDSEQTLLNTDLDSSRELPELSRSVSSKVCPQHLYCNLIVEVCSKIEVLMSDAAANELLAGKRFLNGSLRHISN